jgi:hypothetical protein
MQDARRCSFALPLCGNAEHFAAVAAGVRVYVMYSSSIVNSPPFASTHSLGFSCDHFILFFINILLISAGGQSMRNLGL